MEANQTIVPIPPLSVNSTAEWLAATGWPAARLSQRAQLARGVVSRHLAGKRNLGPLAAFRLEQAMQDAYERREVNVLPVPREKLCPKLARKAAAA